MMKLDEDNPCPHCGNIETLTDRTEDEFKPIIPQELQYNFGKKETDSLNVYIPPTPQEMYGTHISPSEPQKTVASPLDSQETGLSLSESQKVVGPPEPQETETGLPLPPKVAKKRMSQDIPLDSIIPTIDGVSLDPASQKVYFQLSIEFQIILNNASNYREGLSRWKVLLPDRLQNYGLTEDAWEKITQQGDTDEKIQEHLTNLIKVIFGQ